MKSYHNVRFKKIEPYNYQGHLFFEGREALSPIEDEVSLVLTWPQIDELVTNVSHWRKARSDKASVSPEEQCHWTCPALKRELQFSIDLKIQRIASLENQNRELQVQNIDLQAVINSAKSALGTKHE